MLLLLLFDVAPLLSGWHPANGFRKAAGRFDET
jgi:hypothetical protein